MLKSKWRVIKSYSNSYTSSILVYEILDNEEIKFHNGISKHNCDISLMLFDPEINREGLLKQSNEKLCTIELDKWLYTTYFQSTNAIINIIPHKSNKYGWIQRGDTNEGNFRDRKCFIKHFNCWWSYYTKVYKAQKQTGQGSSSLFKNTSPRLGWQCFL